MSRLAIMTMRPINKLRPRQVFAAPVVSTPSPEKVPEPVIEPAVEKTPEPEEAPAIELTREMLNTKTKAELAKFGVEIGLDLDVSTKKSDLVNKIAVAIGI